METESILTRQDHVAYFELKFFPPKYYAYRSCDRCGKGIEIQDGLPVRRAYGRQTNDRNTLSHFFYCTDCIGFTLSRYSYSYTIPDPTEAEIGAKNRHDKALEERMAEINSL